MLGKIIGINVKEKCLKRVKLEVEKMLYFYIFTYFMAYK